MNPGGWGMRRAAFESSVVEIPSFPSADGLNRPGEGLLFMLGLIVAALFPANAMADSDRESAATFTAAAALAENSDEKPTGASSSAGPGGRGLAAAQPATGGLEHVGVTAQKRTSRPEATPVAVSAFTPAPLERN